jgi:hypothetical protein
MARIVLTACLFVALIATNAHAQESLDEIYNKAEQIEFPYQSKCGREAYGQPYTIDTTTLKKVFRFRSEEVGFETCDYDMDNDIKTNCRKEPVDVDVIGKYRYLGFRCIIVSTFEDSSPILDGKTYICTFSDEGFFTDRLLICHTEPSHYINKQYVLTDKNKIRTFEYEYNKNKYDEGKDKQKNNDEPTEWAHEKAYEITKEGKFKQIGDTKTHSLKHRRYYQCDHEDDPMVKYIR